ncbi:hypothetical protein LV178_16880, partial [Burkholderia mallei]|nr:hypothetical protein [Burkholderia mallei]
MERAGESISTSISQSISDRCATPERCGVQVASLGESGKREPAKARRSAHRMRRRGGANVAAGSARSIIRCRSPIRRRGAALLRAGRGARGVRG